METMLHGRLNPLMKDKTTLWPDKEWFWQSIYHLSESPVPILKERCMECLPKANLWVESSIPNLKKYVLGRNLFDA